MAEGTKERTRPKESGIVAGIDLGTVFSSLGVLGEAGEVRLIANSDGNPLTPSAIYFEDATKCYVGEEALEMAHIEPWNVVQFVKGHMGEADFTLEFHGRRWTPQELSSLVIKKLLNDAEMEIGSKIRAVVITVPASFNSAQRLATQEAAILAGVEVLEVVSEPNAAALSVKQPRDTTQMVFDLGGGTFDVTITKRAKNGEIAVVASTGDPDLGGKSWDDLLVNEVASRFEKQTGTDPRDLPESYQDLHRSCLQAKQALTNRMSAAFSVTHQGSRETITVTRQQFTELSSELVQRCKESCKSVLSDGGLVWGDLHSILLVGGASKMPMISDAIHKLSGLEPVLHSSPSSAVTIGAVMVAAGFSSENVSCSNGENVKSLSREIGTKVQDVTRHSLGILVMNANYQERFLEMIAPNTTIPVEDKGRFAYAYDGMTSVQVNVIERSEDKDSSDDQVVGTLHLTDLPSRPRGTPIDVVYRYGTDRILHVDIIDVETGAGNVATLNLMGSLGDAMTAKTADIAMTVIA